MRFHVQVSYSTHADDPREAARMFFVAVKNPGSMLAEVFKDGANISVEEFDGDDLCKIAAQNPGDGKSDDPHDATLVVRTAPRWAWDIIDETLTMDASSKAFDPDLRLQIQRAADSMDE